MRELHPFNTISGTASEAVPVVLVRLIVAVFIAVLALLAVAEISGAQSENARHISQRSNLEFSFALADKRAAYVFADHSAATLSDHLKPGKEATLWD